MGAAETAPKSGKHGTVQQQYKKKETEVSLRLITFVLLMYKQLTSEQRYAISVLLQKEYKRNAIAQAIGVSASTITRELKRNTSSRGKYRWDKAQKAAEKRKHVCSQNAKISDTIKQHAIQCLTQKQWSPKQISGVLALDKIRISHETIYKIIREDKRNSGTLYIHCRHKMKHRKRPIGTVKSNIKNRLSIHQRPAEADGTRFGDFEMDTIIGKNNRDAILTIVERNTNMLFISLLKHGKEAKELSKEVVNILKPYKHILKTITTDNGSEFAAHEYITEKLGVKVYFADPYSSWQKGAVENANGLVRQYIEKGQNFDYVTEQQIAMIQKKINERPRQKLNFKTPKQCFYENCI